jgi:hypothetical protein
MDLENESSGLEQSRLVEPGQGGQCGEQLEALSNAPCPSARDERFAHDGEKIMPVR